MADIPYSVAALKMGIEKCRVNIKTFEEAIDRENSTIKEYREMIRLLEEKVENRIEIERE